MKLSREFNRKESQFLGALSQLDDVLLNLRRTLWSSRNSNGIDREQNEGRSQIDPHLEVRTSPICLLKVRTQRRQHRTFASPNDAVQSSDAFFWCWFYSEKLFLFCFIFCCLTFDATSMLKRSCSSRKFLSCFKFWRAFDGISARCYSYFKIALTTHRANIYFTSLLELFVEKYFLLVHVSDEFFLSVDIFIQRYSPVQWRNNLAKRKKYLYLEVSFF